MFFRVVLLLMCFWCVDVHGAILKDGKYGFAAIPQPTQKLSGLTKGSKRRLAKGGVKVWDRRWHRKMKRSRFMPLSFDFGGALGSELIDNDVYLGIILGAEVRYGDFAGGFQIPLRFLLYDGPPSQEPERGIFSIRKEDWDHWTDFIKVIRFLSYGKKGEPFYLRAGQLTSSTIGHGTLLYLYTNTLQLNHFHLGIEGDFHSPYGGAEWVLNSLLQPRVLGARGYVRPFTFVDPHSYLTRLSIGVSTAIDFQAPYTVKKLVTSFDPSASDDQVVELFRTLGSLGIDIDFALLRRRHIDLTPYVDVNMLLGYGMGVHAGVLLEGRMFLAFQNVLAFRARLEYRMVGPGYLPQYFNTLYDVQKYQQNIIDPATGNSSLVPKLFGLDTMRTNTLHGFYGEFVLAWRPWVQLSVFVDDYIGPRNSNMTVQLQIPTLRYVQFAALYTKRGFEGLSDYVMLDERSLLSVDLRVPIWKYFSIIGRFHRRWQAKLTPSGSLRYDSVNQISLLFGMQYRKNP